MPLAEKSKGDRLKETITILKGVEGMGIHSTDTGYMELKALMTQWVQDGLRVSTIVEFPRHNRRGELELPLRADRAATLNMRVVA